MYCLPKVVIKSYNVIINQKDSCDQRIDSDTKCCKEIKKSATGEGGDYTTGCLLDYHCIKNYYRLKAVDLNRQKELDVESKAIQQIEFVEQLQNLDGNDIAVDTDVRLYLFVRTNLEKIKETRLWNSLKGV